MPALRRALSVAIAVLRITRVRATKGRGAARLTAPRYANCRHIRQFHGRLYAVKSSASTCEQKLGSPVGIAIRLHRPAHRAVGPGVRRAAIQPIVTVSLRRVLRSPGLTTRARGHCAMATTGSAATAAAVGHRPTMRTATGSTPAAVDVPSCRRVTHQHHRASQRQCHDDVCNRLYFHVRHPHLGLEK